MTTAHLFRPLSLTALLVTFVAPFVANAQTSALPLPIPALATDITTYRGDNQRTGYVDCTVNLPLSVAWQNSTTVVSSNSSSPTIHNGVIFFGAGGTVYAINEIDGSVKWKYPKDMPSTSGSFDSPAAIADGKVFIGSDDGKLYVLDEASGASLWQVTTGTGIRSAPAVDDGTVFFGSLEGRLYAIREDNQQSLWGGSFKTLGPITTAPIVSEGDVFFADGNNTIYAAAEATGRLIWSERFDYTVTDSPPLILGSTLYVGSDRTMYGLSVRSGSQKWRTDLSASTTAAAAIAPDGGYLYVPTADATLVAMTASRGQVKWIKLLDSIATAPPTVSQNLVVVVSKGGVVTALDPSTGATKWVYSLHALKAPTQVAYSSDKGQVSAAPLVAGGSIYTLGNEGTLTAFKSSAVDNLKPEATLISPATDQAVAGSQIPYDLHVIDSGSGIDQSSMTLKVDGRPLPVEYLPLLDEIRVKRDSSGQLFGDVPVKLDTLTSGPHRLILKVSDWHGNRLTKSWSFTVDSSLNPADATPAPPASATPPDTSDTDVSSSDTDSADTVTPVNSDIGGTSTASSGGAVASTNAPASSASSGASNGSSASSRTTSSSGGAPTAVSSSGAATSIPTPSAPIQVAPPVSPPSGAGGGFPPPPPI